MTDVEKLLRYGMYPQCILASRGHKRMVGWEVISETRHPKRVHNNIFFTNTTRCHPIFYTLRGSFVLYSRTVPKSAPFPYLLCGSELLNEKWPGSRCTFTAFLILSTYMCILFLDMSGFTSFHSVFPPAPAWALQPALANRTPHLPVWSLNSIFDPQHGEHILNLDFRVAQLLYFVACQISSGPMHVLYDDNFHNVLLVWSVLLKYIIESLNSALEKGSTCQNLMGVQSVLLPASPTWMWLGYL